MTLRGPGWGAILPAALGLELFSRLTRAAEDIRDLRGPKAAVAGWPLLAVGAVFLALMCAGYVTWRRLRRAAPTAVLTAAAAALARLEAARALLVASRAREFCDAASDVVRNYIESQFVIGAQRLTTEEFLQQLAALPASPVAAHQAALSDFMQHSDFIRFSGAAPGAESLEALYQAARTFIIDTSVPSHDPLPAT